MPEREIDSTIRALEAAKQLTKSGKEYWMGRDLQVILAYAKWDKFENVIKRAMMACESAGGKPERHFLQTGKMVTIGNDALVERADYFLTRGACYLIAMNGDTSKPEIGTAQAYFAVQTRRQEITDQLTDEEKRIQLRQRVKDRIKDLNSAAKQAGVTKYGLFHDAGYRGLYGGFRLSEIKKMKRIPPKEDLLDCAGRAELAANEFRITQTEQKLKKDKIEGEAHATETHFRVGREVRNAIANIGGIMPEKLPAETPIKKVLAQRKKDGKALPPPKTDDSDNEEFI